MADSPEDAAFNQGMIAGLELAATVFADALSDWHCDACKSPWRYSQETGEFLDPFLSLKQAGERLEAGQASRKVVS